VRILDASLFSLLAVLACSNPETAPVPGFPAPAKGSTPPLVEQLAGAATSPLTDLNLVRGKIPPVLILAQKAAYAPPADPTCAGLAAEIQLLNEALGKDLDDRRSSMPTLMERGRTEAAEGALGTVRSAAEALIPYRS